MHSPVAENPLETRADFQRAIRRLYEQLRPHFTPGNARVRPGVTGAVFPTTDAELEGFSRLLWGIAPLSAGGAFDDWDRIRTGLANGCDPTHEEYWGSAGDHSQKHVEMAAIGVAIALVPDQLWEPLDTDEQQHVADWLTQINEAALHGSNWLFFRVLTNLGLRRVGAAHDWEQVQSDLDRLESYSLDNGWYSDGTDESLGARDHYIAWEMHVDGLLYAHLADDPDRAARFRDRAREFAGEYIHWFDANGRALPYGRSLTYRFAQAAFWGALAIADAKPAWLSWGELRGLWCRNVRWWLDQPIFTDGGVLSIGYRYPNLKMAEIYNSPSSPYWAFKAALPLSLPSEHPFWTAAEQPLPDLPEIAVQEEPNMLICRNEATNHHYSLAAGQKYAEKSFSSEREKYNKFAYSTEFGVSVASGRSDVLGAAHDSNLVLSEDGRSYRMRETITDLSVSETAVYSRWTPWDDVTVDTWLVPASPWHVRVHHIDASRRLHSAEGGFALDRTGDDDSAVHEHRTEEGQAIARYPAGASAIADLSVSREGSVEIQDSNVNLHEQRTVVPTLTGEHDPGQTWLTAAVVATPDSDWKMPLKSRPRVTVEGDSFTVTDSDGTPIYEMSTTTR